MFGVVLHDETLLRSVEVKQTFLENIAQLPRTVRSAYEEDRCLEST